MKTRICLCVLAALLMIPVAVTAQTKKTKKERSGYSALFC